MMDKSTYIGDNLKVLRKRNKISQEELSKKLELTRSTYSGYENAAAEPSLDTLVKIADFSSGSVFKKPFGNIQ